MLTEPASPSSVLAFVTTLHLAMAALRNHRSAGASPVSSLTLASLALAGTPWLFPSGWGVALGLAVHALWFVTCEALGLTHVPLPSSRPAATAAPAASAAASRRPTPGPPAAPSTPRGFVQTPVLATLDESPDIKTIRLLRPEGFSFEAGQFVPVRLRVDGREYVRCYSISSSPFSAGFLELSVKRQGLVSNALHSTARPGAILSIKAPNGAFRYPAGDDRPIVLLAGGVGITPLVSMLRHAIHAEPSRPVTLIYGGRDEAGLAFKDELLSIARRHPQVRVIFALTRQAVPTGALHLYPGRIDASLLRTAVPDLVHSIAFVCGPTDMIAGLRTVLAELGVPPAQIRSEVFEAAVAAAAGVREEVAVGQGVAGAAPAQRSGSRPDRRTESASGPLQMRCMPGGVTVPVRPGQSLLEAAEESRVDLPSLCRAGVCGTCRVRVTDGQVDCESTTLDAGELGQGYVLACVAMARSHCTVEL